MAANPQQIIQKTQEVVTQVSAHPNLDWFTCVKGLGGGCLSFLLGEVNVILGIIVATLTIAYMGRKWYIMEKEKRMRKKEKDDG